jgi:hypothetical protein
LGRIGSLTTCHFFQEINPKLEKGKEKWKRLFSGTKKGRSMSGFGMELSKSLPNVSVPAPVVTWLGETL